jgi:hypothetical protein
MKNLPRVHVLEAELPKEFSVRDDLSRFVGYDEKYDRVRIFCRRGASSEQAFVSTYCPTGDEPQGNFYQVVDG